MNISRYNDTVQKRIASELRPGEELHWVGEPGERSSVSRHLALAFSWVWMVMFLLPALYLSTAWGAWVWVVAVPLSLLGYCIDHVRQKRAGQMVYILTNHRAAWVSLRRQEVRSLALRQNVVSGTVMRQCGRGDLVFRTDDEETAVFYNIANVRKVLGLIVDLSAGR